MQLWIIRVYSFPSFLKPSDDEDDLYPGTQTERMRLAKSARAPRKARGERINGGQSTTEC